MTPIQRERLALSIYRKRSHLDRALEYSDVKLWVDYYATMLEDAHVKRRVIDELASKQEYYIRYRSEQWNDVKSVRESDSNWKYYSLLMLDNVEPDIINKLWFEELGLVYEQAYDVNLVDLLLAGYQNKEIAAMLGVSEGRISQMFKEARKPKKAETYQGKLCKRGHNDGTGHSTRYTSTGQCVACRRNNRASATERTP